MYRVSPQLLVTNEHIISESSSTSSVGLSGSTVLCILSPLLVACCGSGDANVLRGVDPDPSSGVLCDGDVGFDPVACETPLDMLFSAKRFSSVPKSVLPLSSSLRSPRKRLGKIRTQGSKVICAELPDNWSKLSIRPSLFSNPSIYFALFNDQQRPRAQCRISAYPFGGFLFFSTCVKIHFVL